MVHRVKGQNVVYACAELSSAIIKVSRAEFSPEKVH